MRVVRPIGKSAPTAEGKSSELGLRRNDNFFRRSWCESKAVPDVIDDCVKLASFNRKSLAINKLTSVDVCEAVAQTSTIAQTLGGTTMSIVRWEN
jgi:hypothetical protein